MFRVKTSQANTVNSEKTPCFSGRKRRGKMGRFSLPEDEVKE
jgi:hypothetical protein